MSDSLRAVGAQMANVMYNLAQGGNLPPDTSDLLRDLRRQWDEAVSATPPPQPQMAGTWLPIERADRSINDVQNFEEVGVVLRNSDPYWVRDDDGRVYEAVWTESDNLSFSKGGHWWDLEGESPVDPVEFMPHPLDPRFHPDAKLEDQP